MNQKIELSHPWQHELIELLHKTLVSLDDILIKYMQFSRRARGKFAECPHCREDVNRK